MDAGPPVDSIHQKPVSLDGGTDVTLGSDGQIHVGGDGDGGLSHAEDPDIMPSNDNRPAPTVDAPSQTSLVTQISTEIITSNPELFTSYATSEWNFTWPETSPTPTTSLISVRRPLTASTSISSSSAIAASMESHISLSSTSSVSSTSPTPRLSSSRISSISGTASSSCSVSITSSTLSISSTVSSHTESYSASASSVQPRSSSSLTSQQNPGETVVAAPTDFNVHNPTFYASVALGAVISIATLAAFISWLIRSCSRSRRRCSAQTMVPWGRSGNGDDEGLEAGYGYGKSDMDNAAFAALNLGSREDLAHIQAWCPRGDRDVGEPKRAMSYANGPYHDDHLSSVRENYLDSPYNYGKPASIPTSIHPPFRHLPSHLVADSAIIEAWRRGSLFEKKEEYPAHNGYPYPSNTPSVQRTPIESRDRYSSPRSTCLDPPWDQNLQSHLPRSMAERLRNLGKPTAEPPGQDRGRLPTPDAPPLGQEELEQWGYTFKTSLVNAFNAVAANLGAGGAQPKDDDKLTAPPSRRSTRRSIKHIMRSEGEKSVSRSGSVLTSASKPWTLEEIAGGAGVVHLHLPELDKSDRDALRPPMAGQTLSFGDGEKISILGDLQKNNDVKTGKTQVPLVASSKPIRALVRPDGLFSAQKSTERGNGNTPSHRSSIYSTASARSSAPTQGACEIFRIPSVKINSRGKTNSEEDSVVIQPDGISRRPSSDSSLILRR